MPQKYFAILTDIGTAAMANATVLGKKVAIMHFAVGDGNGAYYAPTPTMTTLKNETWRGVATKVEIDKSSANIINITAIIPTSIGGFTISEMAVFDDKNNMIAISNCADTAKVAISEGISSELEITMQIIVSQASAVNITVDPTVIIATKADIEAHNQDPTAHKAMSDTLAKHTANTSIHTTADEKAGFADKYTKSEADTLIAEVSTGTDGKLANHYTKAETDSKLTNHYTKAETDSKLTNHYTKLEADNKFVQKANKDLSNVDTSILLGAVNNTGAGVINLTHSRTGTTHTLTGTAPTSGIYSARFKATADFAENDIFTINGVLYTAQMPNLEPLESECFKNGATVGIEVDIGAKRINFKLGGGNAQAELDAIANEYGVELTPLQVITTSGDFTLNYDFPVEIAIHGGGGGGGYGHNSSNSGGISYLYGGGGGAGGEIILLNLAKAKNLNIKVTVGTGGITGVYSGTHGTNGNPTTLIVGKKTFVANGGGGGSYAGVGGSGGTGGGAAGGAGEWDASKLPSSGGGLHVRGTRGISSFKYAMRGETIAMDYGSNKTAGMESPSDVCRKVNGEMLHICSMTNIYKLHYLYASNLYMVVGTLLANSGSAGYPGRGGAFLNGLGGVGTGGGGGGYGNGGDTFMDSNKPSTAGGYGAGGSGGAQVYSKSSSGGPGCIVIRKIIMPPKN